MQDHVEVAGNRIGLGGADPLLGQPQRLLQLQPGAWQQVDDEGAAQALGQRLIEGGLE
ncbi:hypothetical protein D3C78_1745980 [compost metagenome]